MIWRKEDIFLFRSGWKLMHKHCVVNWGLLEKQNQWNRYVLQSRITRLAYTRQSEQSRCGCLDTGRADNPQSLQLFQSGAEVLKNFCRVPALQASLKSPGNWVLKHDCNIDGNGAHALTNKK